MTHSLPVVTLSDACQCSDDFDSISVVRITHTGGHASATFERRQEGLDGEPSACPDQPPG
jgi:hypothetical protein